MTQLLPVFSEFLKAKPSVKAPIRHDWTHEQVAAIFNLPIVDLLFLAQAIHRQNFDPHKVQISTLLSIKTGGCPEDCAYCPQSQKNKAGVEAEKMMQVQGVLESAKRAKERGAGRFCMGGAWREPKDRDMDQLCAMIKGVKELGLESCLTAGMLTKEQAQRFKDAGLDYYNHNLDSSEEFYSKIITTRTYQERLDTLEVVRDLGINVCCGGIIGMGETPEDRVELIRTLANLPTHPESVPINLLIKVEGTPLENVEDMDIITFVRMIATARITMPQSHVRMAAGRELLSEEGHALCFMAGANSIFWGEKLLTTPNPSLNQDQIMLGRFGLSPSFDNSCKQ